MVPEDHTLAVFDVSLEEEKHHMIQWTRAVHHYFLLTVYYILPFYSCVSYRKSLGCLLDLLN